MDKAQFRAVYNRKNCLRKNGTALIQIESYLRGKKKYFSTSLYVTPDQWDNKKGVIKNHPNSIRLNKQIRDAINKLEDIELKRRDSGQPFNLQYLTDFVNGNYPTNFIEFCRKEAQTESLRNTSKIQHRATFKHFEAFRPGVEFENLNFELLSDFEKYLRALGLHQNTIVKHFAIIRRYVNLAIDKDLFEINKYPFRKIKIKKAPTKRDYLTPDEMEQIENLNIPQGELLLQMAKDKFMFAVYTGLRYGDLSELKPDSLTTINGDEWLIIEMQKTGETVRIPIFELFEGRGLEIFYRYAGKHKEHSLFPYQRNDCANKQLKKVVELAGIKKHVTFHVARHTQATYLLYKGVSVTTVQKLLGHRRLETTQIYSKVMDMTILKELQKVSYS